MGHLTAAHSCPQQSMNWSTEAPGRRSWIPRLDASITPILPRLKAMHFDYQDFILFFVKCKHIPEKSSSTHQQKTDGRLWKFYIKAYCVKAQQSWLRGAQASTTWTVSEQIHYAKDPYCILHLSSYIFKCCLFTAWIWSTQDILHQACTYVHRIYF